MVQKDKAHAFLQIQFPVPHGFLNMSEMIQNTELKQADPKPHHCWV